MGLFSALRKPIEDKSEIKDNSEPVKPDFSDDEKKRRGIQIGDMQELTYKDGRSIDRPHIYESVEDFAKNASNEDLILALQSRICIAGGNTYRIDKDVDKYDLEDDERKEIKHNIEKGICKPTKSIIYDKIEDADIRITQVYTKEEEARLKKQITSPKESQQAEKTEKNRVVIVRKI